MSSVATLARPAVRSRSHVLASVLLGCWYLLGLVVMVLVSSLAAWDTWRFWALTEGLSFVPMVAPVYLVSFWTTRRLLRLAQVGSLTSTLISVGLGFLVLITVVALGRLYYSRSFLLAAFVITFFWQWAGWFLFSRVKPRLALIPGGMAESLMRLPGVTWLWLREPDVAAVDAVVADLHAPHSADWVRFMAECGLRRIPVYHAAVIYESITGRLSLGHHSEHTLAAIQLPPLYPTIKRIMDLTAVMVLSPIALPLLLLLALLVRLSSPGKVLYWQQRIGQGGKQFWLAKFRTMRVNAEDHEAQLASTKDPRVTRLGTLMRKFRLDELPQLLNVLRGEMSLIGPRPEQIPFAQQFAEEIPLYPYRHLVKPGITGWAQVMQGYAANGEETRLKLAHDLYYVKHLSFWLDGLIVVKTVRTILTGFGAR